MEGTEFLVVIAVLGIIYWILMSIVNGIRNFFGGIFGGGGGGYSSGNSNSFKRVIQRGDQIEVTRGDNTQTRFYGELRGWSSQSVSFVDQSGDTGTYDNRDGFTYHY